MSTNTAWVLAFFLSSLLVIQIPKKALYLLDFKLGGKCYATIWGANGAEHLHLFET